MPVLWEECFGNELIARAEAAAAAAVRAEHKACGALWNGEFAFQPH